MSHQTETGLIARVWTRVKSLLPGHRLDKRRQAVQERGALSAKHSKIVT